MATTLTVSVSYLVSGGVWPQKFLPRYT